MTAASLRFGSVYEEDLEKLLNHKKIYTKTTRLFAHALVDYHAIEILSSQSNCLIGVTRRF